MMAQHQLWRGWLKPQQDQSLYFMINNMSSQQTIELFYSQQWVAEAFPLYRATPLAELAQQGPWLIKAKPELRYDIVLPNALLQSQDWGWCYLSLLSWQEQLNFWRSRLLIDIAGQVEAFRFMDPRVMSQLLPAFNDKDWLELAYPVQQLIITPHATQYSAPQQLLPIPYTHHYCLSENLYHAWQRSPLALRLLVQNIENQLWQHSVPQTEDYYHQLGEIQSYLLQWVTVLANNNKLHSATLTNANNYLLKMCYSVQQQQAAPQKGKSNE